jgi:hypothetical protein
LPPARCRLTFAYPKFTPARGVGKPFWLRERPPSCTPCGETSTKARNSLSEGPR